MFLVNINIGTNIYIYRYTYKYIFMYRYTPSDVMHPKPGNRHPENSQAHESIAPEGASTRIWFEGL